MYFARGTAVMEAPFSPGAPPTFGTPVEIFPSDTLLRAPVLRHVFGFDERRFVLAKAQSSPVPLTVALVQNWTMGTGQR